MNSLTDLREVVDVVIGVDTHVHTHSAAVIDAATGGVLDEITVDATAQGLCVVAVLLLAGPQNLRVGVTPATATPPGLARSGASRIPDCGVAAARRRTYRRWVGRLWRSSYD
jgi:hypothetical protein